MIVTHPVVSALTAYFSGVLVYGAGMLVFNFFPFHRDFINRGDVALHGLPPWLLTGLETFFTIIGRNTFGVLLHLYLGYLVIGLLWFLFYRYADLSHNRPLLFLRTLKKVILGLPEYFARLGSHIPLPKLPVTPEEKTNLLFFAVKFFYLPLMLNFFFGNLAGVVNSLSQVQNLGGMPEEARLQTLYFLVFNFFLLIDTSYFVLGYAFEFQRWGNRVRSVEPTLLGWVVTLACYPPFNDITSRVLGWGSADYMNFWGSIFWTKFFLGISLLLFAVYVWATLSLGLKSSNLTNRGTVTRGAYAIVRHPAYVSKNFAWLIMGLPIVFPLNGSPNWWALVSILAWMGIYFLRAVTEERHLSLDPDYRAYAQKVKYRFIPGVW